MSFPEHAVRPAPKIDETQAAVAISFRKMSLNPYSQDEAFQSFVNDSGTALGIVNSHPQDQVVRMDANSDDMVSHLVGLPEEYGGEAAGEGTTFAVFIDHMKDVTKSLLQQIVSPDKRRRSHARSPKSNPTSTSFFRTLSPPRERMTSVESTTTPDDMFCCGIDFWPFTLNRKDQTAKTPIGQVQSVMSEMNRLQEETVSALESDVASDSDPASDVEDIPSKRFFETYQRGRVAKPRRKRKDRQHGPRIELQTPGTYPLTTNSGGLEAIPNKSDLNYISVFPNPALNTHWEIPNGWRESNFSRRYSYAPAAYGTNNSLPGLGLRSSVDMTKTMGLYDVVGAPPPATRRLPTVTEHAPLICMELPTRIDQAVRIPQGQGALTECLQTNPQTTAPNVSVVMSPSISPAGCQATNLVNSSSKPKTVQVVPNGSHGSVAPRRRWMSPPQGSTSQVSVSSRGLSPLFTLSMNNNNNHKKSTGNPL